MSHSPDDHLRQPDPAEIEPTTNSTGAPLDMERVAQEGRAAAEIEAAAEPADEPT